MEMLHNFHFIRPWFLLLLLPFFALSFLYFQQRIQQQHWRSLLDRELIPHVVQQGLDNKGYYFFSIVIFAIVLTILSLAGPAWKKQEKPVFQSDSALVILLDLSLSMLSEDVSPSRIERAKYKIRDLLSLRNEGETALVAYAGDAFTVTPLTDDVDTIISQLSALSPEVMPVLGFRADLAMQRAAELLKAAGHTQGEILLITDQVNRDNDIPMARELFADNYRVSVMTVGTDEGAPIPLPNGQYLKIRNEIVIPKLEVDVLEELSSAGGGMFYQMQLDETDILHYLKLIEVADVSQANDTTHTADEWIEEGPWLLLLILPVAALGFRKGYLYLLVLFLVPVPEPVMALEWDDLWKNADQRGQQFMQEQQYEKAGEIFTNPNWQSVARFRAGDYEQTIDLLKGRDDTTSRYNRATAMAKAGQLQDALKEYDALLEAEPEHEDARYNRDLIDQALQQQQSQQNQQSQSGDQEQQGEQSQENSQGQQQGGNPQNSDSVENENSQHGSSNSSNDSTSGDEQQSSLAEDGLNKEQQSQEHTISEEQLSQQESDSKPENQQNEKTEQQNREHSSDEKMQSAMSEVQNTEQQQAVEQWLRRIPDDPSGLLKRKFQYQYQQRRAQQSSGQNW